MTVTSTLPRRNKNMRKTQAYSSVLDALRSNSLYVAVYECRKTYRASVIKTSNNAYILNISNSVYPVTLFVMLFSCDVQIQQIVISIRAVNAWFRRYDVNSHVGCWASTAEIVDRQTPWNFEFPVVSVWATYNKKHMILPCNTTSRKQELTLMSIAWAELDRWQNKPTTYHRCVGKQHICFVCGQVVRQYVIFSALEHVSVVVWKRRPLAVYYKTVHGERWWTSSCIIVVYMKCIVVLLNKYRTLFSFCGFTYMYSHVPLIHWWLKCFGLYFTSKTSSNVKTSFFFSRCSPELKIIRYYVLYKWQLYLSLRSCKFHIHNHASPAKTFTFVVWIR